MEKKLEDFVKAARVLSGIDDLADTTPIVLHRTNPAISKTSLFVIGNLEPNQMVLPLNVIWLNFDASSIYYQKALQRQSKDPDSNGIFAHTWKELYFYADAFVTQFYDDEDREAIDDTVRIPVASTGEFGLVKLKENPPEGEDPHVILANDSRLTDARTPTEHNHSEIPATLLAHSAGYVKIINSSDIEDGSVIMALNDTEAEWHRLQLSDIKE